MSAAAGVDLKPIVAGASAGADVTFLRSRPQSAWGLLYGVQLSGCFGCFDIPVYVNVGAGTGMDFHAMKLSTAQAVAVALGLDAFEAEREAQCRSATAQSSALSLLCRVIDVRTLAPPAIAWSRRHFASLYAAVHGSPRHRQRRRRA